MATELPTAEQRIDQMFRMFVNDLREIDNMARRPADEVLQRRDELRPFIAAQPIDWIEALPPEYVTDLRQAIADHFGVLPAEQGVNECRRQFRRA